MVESHRSSMSHFSVPRSLPMSAPGNGADYARDEAYRMIAVWHIRAGRAR